MTVDQDLAETFEKISRSVVTPDTTSVVAEASRRHNQRRNTGIAAIALIVAGLGVGGLLAFDERGASEVETATEIQTEVTTTAADELPPGSDSNSSEENDMSNEDNAVESQTQTLRESLYGWWRFQSGSEKYPDLVDVESIIEFEFVTNEIDTISLRTEECWGNLNHVTWVGNIATVGPKLFEQADEACDGPTSKWTYGPFEEARFEIALSENVLTVTHYDRFGDYAWDATYEQGPATTGPTPATTAPGSTTTTTTIVQFDGEPTCAGSVEEAIGEVDITADSGFATIEEAIDAYLSDTNPQFVARNWSELTAQTPLESLVVSEQQSLVPFEDSDGVVRLVLAAYTQFGRWEIGGFSACNLE